MSGFRERARAAIAEEAPAATLAPILRRVTADSRARLATLPPDTRERARAARAHAVDHLEELHERLRAACARQGTGYHHAATAEEAVAIVGRLLGNARRIAKSKSMVAEEIGLTPALRADGREVLETDIGEYIVDIEGRGPSHLIAPALHLNRARIRDLLAGAGADVPDDDPERLSRAVRDAVAAFFADVDAGVTGANAVIADSGRIVIVENEGNVALGVSRPRLHVAVTGLEKVVADEAAALAVLQTLAPSGSAQPLTAYTHFLGGPGAGKERHLVVVDNGRSAIRADERYRDALRCIRCGACMNVCPVYTAAGGHAYGSTYVGPIGAVLSPLLWRDGRHADLPAASSLCGRCTEVCPVGIPLHRMLLDLRAERAEGGALERLGWKAWAAAFAGGGRGRVASGLARLGLRAGASRAPLPGAGGRRLPNARPARDPAMLIPVEAVAVEPPPATEPVEPVDEAALFRARAEANGMEVAERIEPRAGDRRVRATAGVAATGSVALTGEAAERGALMDARRVVAELDAGAIARYPRDLAGALGGDGDALILTGASRTADIEKRIVRGIHGPDALAVELRAKG